MKTEKSPILKGTLHSSIAIVWALILIKKYSIGFNRVLTVHLMKKAPYRASEPIIPPMTSLYLHLLKA